MRSHHERLAAAEALQDDVGEHPMARFGGRPYHDGEQDRCPECNGLVVWANRNWPVVHREALCLTCGANARLTFHGNPVRIPRAGFRRTA